MASAMTVPERVLNMSSLMTTTGRRPPCSCPRAGSRSAQKTSPLSIRAIVEHLRKGLGLPALVRPADLVFRILGQAACASDGGACHGWRPVRRGFYLGIA